MPTNLSLTIDDAEAALGRLWPLLTPEQRAGLQDQRGPHRWRRQPEPEPVSELDKAANLAVLFLRQPGIEGCELEAYPDPETGGAPWTIGWGNTRLDGRPVRQGDRITQDQADELQIQTVQALGLASGLHVNSL